MEDVAQVSVESVDGEEKREEDQLVGEVGDCEAVDLELEGDVFPVSVFVVPAAEEH